MDDNGEKRTKKKKSIGIGVMDIILIIVGVALFSFTVCMIKVYTIYGSIPDTLVTCVFAALGGECGIMGWIKTTKDKRTDRRWQIEDEKRHKAEIEKEEHNGMG